MSTGIYRSQTGCKIRVQRIGYDQMEDAVIVRDGMRLDGTEPVTIIRIGYGERSVYLLLDECITHTYINPQ